MSASHGQPSHEGGKRSNRNDLGLGERVIQNDARLRGVPPVRHLDLAQGSATWSRLSPRGKFDPRGASTPLPQSGGAPPVWGRWRSHRSGFSPRGPVRGGVSPRGRAGVWGVFAPVSGVAARRVGEQNCGGRE